MISNIFFTLVLIYFFVTIFLYFYQDKLLYHPNVNARSNYELDHKVDEILIPSDNDLIAWHYKNKENFKTLVFFHGNGSKGKPSEKGLYKDAENILNWLKSNKIFENNIIIYGESLGTAVAVHIAQNKNFSGIILEAPFTSMIELGQKYYPIFPVKFLLKDKYESFKKINKIKSPVLVMHGKKDKIVPFYMGKQIFEILPSPKFSYFNEQDDHMMEYNQDLIDSIKNFINQLS